MKHEVRELYKIDGDRSHIYSAEAIKDVRPELVSQIRYRTSTEKPFKIYDKVGSNEYRYGYMYGEKFYFDTAEEREEQREKVRKEKEELESRTFKLEGMTIKEVKDLISSIPDDSIVEKGTFRIY